jgi:hypothetical protein
MSPPAKTTRAVVSINNFFRILIPFVKKDEEPSSSSHSFWCWPGLERDNILPGGSWDSDSAPVATAEPFFLVAAGFLPVLSTGR